MATPILESSYVTGEIAPALFGNVSLARMRSAATTLRNFWVRYSGGAYSRAGTAFVGFSKQTGRSYPPRLIPFQFSINQGLALEFGNFYMRVVFQGAYVTESPFQITGISQTNPAVVGFQSLSTAVSVTANVGAVSSSYNRGDTVTPAGGVAVTPAIFLVNTTTLAKATLLSGGTGYAVNDTITLSGGTTSQPAVITVLTVSGGAIQTFAISNGGSYTANALGTMTQLSTSGAGTGATFNNGIFGPLMLTVQMAGGYTSIPANPANQASSSGAGLGATYTIVWATPLPLVNGDWVFIAGVNGMTQVNGQTYVIGNLTGTPTTGTFTLFDVYGNPINATAFSPYTSGGTASRIYTLTTPYSEVDLKYLKFTQSADVMSICCVNQQSSFEYAPQDLARFSDTNWVFTEAVPASTISPPPALSGAASSGGGVDYKYQVTAVNPNDGTESIASPIADIAAAVNIAATAGSITLTWTGVLGVNEYNIYKATPSVSGTVPAGALFGYVGSAYGTQFVDSNIVADMSQVPPLHKNPFARGQIVAVNITSGGAGASFTATINSLTGSGAVLQTVVVSSALAAVIIQDPGHNYLPTDTITFNNGATGTLVVGAQSGTYPAVVTYFQQRRAYGYTLNNPDTYFMSQPGAYTNFDSRIPTIDSDAIIGDPWAVEVNGIQFMTPVNGGLVVLTGLEAYLLTGAGGSAFSPQPLGPASQSAQPQGFNGCSQTVPPIRIYQDILYVQAKGSTYRNFNFTISQNTFTGEDLTLNSTHLFTGYTILEHAWCEEPYKLLWAVRNDGVLLSLTFMRTEKVAGWARHDTNGIFVSVCSITEPPVDALYLATQRQIGVNTAYVVERMNNRLWSTVEGAWCVDCGFSLPQPQPNATLSASSANGLGAVTGAVVLVGGASYSSAVIGTVVDAPTTPNGPMGPGSGAVPAITVVGGVIMAVTFAPGNQGQNYLNPQITFTDPAGSAGGDGTARARLTLDNSMTFTASAPVFSPGNVGSVIRMGGGVAQITAYVDSQHVTAVITTPISAIQPNSTRVQPQAVGSWTMTAPVTTVSGLNALIGATVTGLADGVKITPRVVSAQGTITLDAPASQITVGMGFHAQLQSPYLDAGEPTVQGGRKKEAAATVRVEASGPFRMGSNQVDGSTLSPMQLAPRWSGLTAAPINAVAPYNSTTVPLYTGDIRAPIQGGFQKPGQIAIEQDDPYPIQVLAIVPEVLVGDTPSQEAKKAA